ncbi:MAG: DUF6600 domain-containing protein [Acidobacteriota bacterium]
MKFASKSIRSILPGALLAVCLSPGSALAQERDAYGTATGEETALNEYGEPEIRQTVARISDIGGSVSLSRGDDPDEWQAADRNVPVTYGDRLYTGSRSRVELQVHGGDFVRIGSRTDLAVLNLNDDTKQFAVKAGVASFRIRRLDENDVFEVDTPNAAVTFERPGNYRVDVDPGGNTRVSVRSGLADVAAGGGSVSLSAGDAMHIDGIDSPQYDIAPLSRADAWDRWVALREDRITHARSYEYVSSDVVGVDDLDAAGRWEDIPEYGHCWTPTTVAVGWAPYRIGHWVWQDPWGWTWVSAEPWGWAPYHYGRWVTWSSRWFWVPVAPRVRFVAYSPALVAFVGAGPGWSTTVVVGGGGFVGWFPLAPRDPFVPWWGRRYAPSAPVTHVTYVNRTYVTVVNQNTFISGGIVTNNYVRDQAVLREAAAAPVVRGVPPVVPTRESLRVAPRPGAAAAPRPPAAVVARPVVARVAPPPGPPRFQEKLPVIRENRGAPVEAAAAAQIAVRERSRPRAATAVRPVATESGRVTLAPRGRAAEAPKAAPRAIPVAPVRGREMATADRPVASAPVVAPRAVPRAAPAQQTREAAPAPPAAGQAPSPRPAERPAPDVRQREEPTARPQEERRERPAAPAPTAAPPERSEPRAVERPAATPRPREVSQPERSRERSVASPAPTQGRAPAASRERAVAPPPTQRPAPAASRERAVTPPSAQRPAPAASHERPAASAPERGRPAERPTPRAREREKRQPEKTKRPEKTPVPEGNRQ